jgi:hypothetical protein
MVIRLPDHTYARAATEALRRRPAPDPHHECETEDDHTLVPAHRPLAPRVAGRGG